jgi:hypothetical protein
MSKEKPTHDKPVIFAEIVEKWGRVAQMIMTLEETAELQKEVCKILRGDYSSSRMDSLATEIADVELMCQQLKFMFSLESKVEIEMDYKLERVIKRLHKEG